MQSSGDDLVKFQDRFYECFGDGAEPVVARAPGRVNLIGEHTDYNEGFVLPMAIHQTVRVAVRPREGDRLVIYSADFDDRVDLEFGLDPEQIFQGWARYVVGVAEELRAQGHAIGGAEILVKGDVPIGAGLSSSAALEVSALLALCEAFECEVGAIEAAELCQRVEHRWVGVQCGIMDQMASRIGGVGNALLIDCRDRSWERIPFRPDDTSIRVVDSGVRRELAASQYNVRLQECAEGVATMQKIDSSVGSLRDASPELFERTKDLMRASVAARCRHVITENARVLAAVDCLRSGELEKLGRLINAAHESMRDDYEASHPIVDRIVLAAQSVRGVLGARVTGAGWGGCTVNLVRNEAVESFDQVMRETFEECGVEGRVIPVTDSD
jgi:galactokinase